MTLKVNTIGERLNGCNGLMGQWVKVVVINRGNEDCRSADFSPRHAT